MVAAIPIRGMRGMREPMGMRGMAGGMGRNDGWGKIHMGGAVAFSFGGVTTWWLVTT
jgi:hypothetical protein